MTREKACTLRAMIEKASASLDDADALSAVELFPAWNDTAHYDADERARYAGVLYRCLQMHDAQAGWTPEAAPSLWAKVLIPDPEVIPEWEQPNSANPYMKGDRVRYHGKVYESQIDNNIWSPESYPAGWREVST